MFSELLELFIFEINELELVRVAQEFLEVI